MSVIRVYRKKRKLTQEELAKVLNVSHTTVKRWESKKTVPTLIQAHTICNKLNLPFSKLYNDYI